MITVATARERWEIEFLENGGIEVEKFISNGEIYGEETLKELLEREKSENAIIEFLKG